MLQFFYKMRNNKKGFTLIELIVVIAILAILALLAIPRLSGFSESAKQAADKEAAAVVANAAAMFYATTGDTSIELNELTGAGLLIAGDQAVKSDEYSTGIAFPILVANDVVTVRLDGDTADYIISK